MTGGAIVWLLFFCSIESELVLLNPNWFYCFFGSKLVTFGQLVCFRNSSEKPFQQFLWLITDTVQLANPQPHHRMLSEIQMLNTRNKFFNIFEREKTIIYERLKPPLKPKIKTRRTSPFIFE